MIRATLFAVSFTVFRASADRLIEAGGSVDENSLDATANPIRRVVSLLQGIAAKIEKEGENEHVLYDKFMCACKKEHASLKEDILKNQGAVPQLESDIEETESKLKRLGGELETLAENLALAKQALGAAQEQRSKGEKDYNQQAEELKEYIAALNSAIPSVEKGSSGAGTSNAFLQSDLREPLLKAAVSTAGVDDDDRASVTSFLSGDTSYAPQGMNIVGIFKTMKETNEKTLAEVNADEANQVNMYEALKAAKSKELKTVASAIRKKTEQVGDLKIFLVEAKGDHGRAADGLSSDNYALGDLETSCAKKESETTERRKTRQAELVAISDTIGILNSDDNLELFKKTMKSASLLQFASPAKLFRQKALLAIRAVPHKESMPALGLLTMKLAGSSMDIGDYGKEIEVVATHVSDIIDGMIKLMKQEQGNDDSEYATCQRRLADGADKLRDLNRKVKGLDREVDERKEIVSTMDGAIKSLTANIEALDETVKEATSQRQSEHAAYVDAMSQNNAAKDILGVAKNRLNKFYNPKHFKGPKKQPNLLDTGLAQLLPSDSFVQVQQSTKSDEVFRMLDALVNDITVEMTEVQHEESQSQRDYEVLLKDTRAKRVEDGTALTAKQDIKADAEEAFVGKKQAKMAETAQRDAQGRYMPALHAECDWLMSNYRLRQSARHEEMSALKSAKYTISNSAADGVVALTQAGKHAIPPHTEVKALRGAM